MSHSLGAHEIISNLWIGSTRDENNKRWMERQGITHDVHAMLDRSRVTGIPILWIPIGDFDEENIYIHFKKTNAFIHKALKSRGRVLVHCYRGKSRSVTLVAAYLMWRYRITASEALSRIKKRRKLACPNDGFGSQLRRYQKYLDI